MHHRPQAGRTPGTQEETWPRDLEGAMDQKSGN